MATVGLFEAVASGRHLPKAWFIVTNGKGAELAKVDLQDLFVTSQQVGVGPDGGSVESVTLGFGAISITVGGVTEEWNVQTNE